MRNIPRRMERGVEVEGGVRYWALESSSGVTRIACRPLELFY